MVFTYTDALRVFELTRPYCLWSQHQRVRVPSRLVIDFSRAPFCGVPRVLTHTLLARYNCASRTILVLV